MLHVDRSQVPRPGSLNSAQVEEALGEINEYLSTSTSSRAKSRPRFDRSLYQSPDIVEALATLFHNKCAYCETFIGAGSSPAVNHFRPKWGALNLDGTSHSEYYCWLVYRWENLYRSCRYCNRAKGPRFPLAGRRAPRGADWEHIQREKPLLLDPCQDRPHEHLYFEEDGRVAGLSDRGEVTIEVLALNRPLLVADRRSAINQLRDVWKQAFGARDAKRQSDSLRILQEKIQPSSEFSAALIQSAQRWATDLIGTSAVTKKAVATANAVVDAVSEVAPVLIDVGISTATQLAGIWNRGIEASQIQSQVALESKEDKSSYFGLARYVERIELENFKAFKQFSMPLNDSSYHSTSWKVLLGENGTGKSTILQAIALALMGSANANALKLDARKFIRYGESNASVKLYVSQSREPIELTLSAKSRNFKSRLEDPALLMLAYGATRLLPRPGMQPKDKGQFVRAGNLFDPFQPLNDSEKWLLSLEAKQFNHVARTLKSLLALERADQIKRIRGKSPRVEVHIQGQRFGLLDLSDGYQSVLGLATDIMDVMLQRWPTMDVAEGVVLIDEIGVHLHPRWRMRIVRDLRLAFPRVQFVVATHEPLCLRGLFDNEVAVMRRTGKQEIFYESDLPSVSGLSIDQLLTSEYFGLGTTIDPVLEKTFDEYHKLLTVRKPSAHQRKRIAALKEQLAKHQLMGSTRRERLALEVADQYLARASATPDRGDRKKLKDSAKKKLAEIWAKIDLED